MPEATHASTAEASDKPSLLKPEPGLAIWTVITFALLLVILKKLAWGPMVDTLDKREKAIRDSLDEARKARDAAASSLEEQARILAEARKEAQALVAQSRSDAERAREEMTARARTEADKIIVAGREAIEHEKRAALIELRNTTVDLALGAAEKLLRARMDDNANRELVTSYVKELEAGGSGAGNKAT